MSFFDNLAAQGLTIPVLQILLFAGAAIFILGNYWKEIVTGAGIIFCIVVFASPTDGSKIEWSDVLPNSKTEKQSKTKEVEPQVSPAPSAPQAFPIDEGKAEFMHDCQDIGHYSKEKCESLWSTQEDDLNNSGGKPIKVPSKMFSNNKPEKYIKVRNAT